MSDTDLDEELQYPDHPINTDEKEEGECTDQEDPDDMPPLVSADDKNTYPSDPWNDGDKFLQEGLYSLEPEPDYEEYGVPDGTIQRSEILHQVHSMHRCVDEVKRIVQTIITSQENVREILIQRAEVLFKVNNVQRSMGDVSKTVKKVSGTQEGMKDILRDLHDIIKDMERMDESEPQDTELLQKIKTLAKE